MADILPVFDGHNDVLLRLWNEGDGAIDRFLSGTRAGHIDLPRARAGGLAGGLFAIFPPSPHDPNLIDRMPKGGYAIPLPTPLDPAEGVAATIGMASILFRLEAASKGALAVCRSVAEIRAAIARGAMAAVFHVEGAEAIGPDLAMLDVLHAAGLRSLGPVWSRNNVFGDGVPMRFPATADHGGGLSEAGRALVKRCNELRIVVDLSHMTEKGFGDVAALSTAPLVATHSNVHALCPHSRNLSDAQFEAIRASGGVVGLNFATAFLREDGSMDPHTALDVLVRHLAAMVERLGEDGVALGSDFDGATIPHAVGDAAGLPRLVGAMRAAGFGDALVAKIARENWLSVLQRTWGG
ncbi:dipeptidase [Antarcticirhabdus aurantiaca]|uniref:Dipeptidase n=1 Tax=Antarcticirhabdus aurantiaca TaxID=2606717 RepID=A0ACD4NST7_9HYPH|nr:dipeptidase [Antarcticirhabdus aurantiaca]WAJ29720.1 dipeptidase [Jeongeuplla avenae]